MRIARNIAEVIDSSQHLYRWGVKRFGASEVIHGEEKTELEFPELLSDIVDPKSSFRLDLFSRKFKDLGEKGLLEDIEGYCGEGSNMDVDE